MAISDRFSEMERVANQTILIIKNKETNCATVTAQPLCSTVKRNTSIVKESICDPDDESDTCTNKIETKAINSECQISCEIDFAARRSLLRYKCDKCGRECPSKHKLKRHLSTHSDARPFPCKLCGRSFKWSEYLQKHMRLQHPSGKKGTYNIMCMHACIHICTYVNTCIHIHTETPFIKQFRENTY